MRMRVQKGERAEWMQVVTGQPHARTTVSRQQRRSEEYLVSPLHCLSFNLTFNAVLFSV